MGRSKLSSERSIKSTEDLVKMVREAERLGLERWLKKYLVYAYEDARKGKLKTYDEHNFDLFWMENICTLAKSVIGHRYEPGASVAFVIREPMIREIFAAPFRDRVIHHLLYNISAEWWNRRFVYASSSCREGKGTLFAIKRAQKHMRQVSLGGKRKAWVLKFDLKGYFMSLPRDELYARIRAGLREQFKCVGDSPIGRQIMYLCEYLWRKVILDDPVTKARQRGPKSDWDSGTLPPEKSLYCQPYGTGIVIGNLTSQLASNIYLDQLDRYITYALGYKFYGRYVDDFYIMVPDEDYERVKQDVARIRLFLKGRLKLTLHPKKFNSQPVSHGFQFVGARVYLHGIYPSDRVQSHFKQTAYLVATGQEDADALIPYLGLMKHMDARKFEEEVFGKFGWGA